MMTRVILAVACAASCGLAQSAARFEVISIRPHVVDPSNDSSDTKVLPGGRVVGRNVSVKKMIRIAFTADDSQILDAPGWVDTASYDIDAKTAGGVEVTDKNISALVLGMLESRFQFRFHREQREKPIYRLETAKDGVKLKQDPEDGRPSISVNSSDAAVTLSATHVTMKDLAASMQRQVGRNIEDRTGLAGQYDVDLKWSTERAGIDTPLPSVFTALEEVGLRLVSAKGPVEMVVVDGVERASAN